MLYIGTSSMQSEKRDIETQWKSREKTVPGKIRKINIKYLYVA